MHDLAIESDTVDGFLSVAAQLRGTVETGAVEGWPIIRRAIPDARIAVVLRPLDAVTASLEAVGADPPHDDLRRRAAALNELSHQNDVLTVAFAALADPRVCAELQEHVLGQPFDWAKWRAVEGVNIQLDLPGRLARLMERGPAIERLKTELAERLANPKPFVLVREERWSDVVDEAMALAAAHHAEATHGAEGAFAINREVTAQLEAAGLLRVLIARVDGRVAGYCCWTREVNVESDQPPTMTHGPFYVAPECAHLRIGRRLLEASREQFAREGFAVLRLHHTVYGRGARTGILYERLGAVEHQRDYIWRIGDHA